MSQSALLFLRRNDRARTIARLAGPERLGPGQVAAAIQYRVLDRAPSRKGCWARSDRTFRR